jgi:hypothetical protein
MNHVGLLCVKNERDVLAEALESYRGMVRDIIAQDGSTDGSREMLRGSDQVVMLFTDEEATCGHRSFRDRNRQVCVSWILLRYGSATWVTLLHPDEFLHDDPNEAIRVAEEEGASYVLWAEYRFFPHVSERGALEQGSCRSYRKHCCGPFFEVRQFRLTHHRLYDPAQVHGVLPSGPPPAKRARVLPRYRHYPFRSLEQIKRHAWELIRDERMVQPDWDWVCELVKRDAPDADYYREALPAPANSPLAAWYNVFLDTGELPDPRPYLERAERR